VLGEGRQARVEVAAEVADDARGLGDRLLPPAVGDGAEERDERRRRRDDDLLVHAVLDEARILLEGGAHVRLAGDEEHDELGRVLELRPVALRRQLGDVLAHLAGVVAQPREPLVVVPRPERLEVRLPGELRVDDDALATGERHDEVGAQPPVLEGDVLLRLEVAVLDHAGHLDHAPKLDLAPAPADVRPVAERAHEVAGLAAKLLLGVHQLADLRAELRIGARARHLELLELPVHLLQRLGDRRDELLDRLLARLELRLREREERLALRREDVGGERLHRGGERVPLAAVEAAHDEPGTGGAEEEPDEQSDDHWADER